MYLKKTIIPFFILLFILLFIPNRTVNASDMELLDYFLQFVPNKGKVLKVDQEGNGDYTSICKAVEKAKDGDILLIYPGVYNEHILFEDKTLYLIGVDKENCIIKANSHNYFKAPLRFASGSICNLTIIAEDTGENEDVYYKYLESSNDIIRLVNEKPSYAIHIESDYSIGKEINIIGCDLISYTSGCIGIGTRANGRIKIQKCNFYSRNGYVCLFFHNALLPTASGKSDFQVIDCKMWIDACYPVATNSYGDFNPIDITFQNVKVLQNDGSMNIIPQIFIEGDKKCSTDTEGWLELSGFKLTSNSFGNDIWELNY